MIKLSNDEWQTIAQALSMAIDDRHEELQYTPDSQTDFIAELEQSAQKFQQVLDKIKAVQNTGSEPTPVLYDN